MTKDICGIYKITNNINKKVYIGQSIHIFQRWKEHKRKFKNGNSYLYKAMRCFGINNFTFDLVCECEKEQLNRLEKEYIEHFKSNQKEYGYNLTNGGDKPPQLSHEKNPNSKMNKDDVWDIRESYKNLEHRNDVYKRYQNIISINTFLDIWRCKTWRGIHEDAYTEDTRNFHRNDYDKIKAKEHTRTVSDEEIIHIRNIYNEGVLALSEAYEKFSHINYNTFLDIWNGNTFRHIQSTLPNNRSRLKKPKGCQDGSKNNAAKLTDEQVQYIRNEKGNGKKPMEVYHSHFSDIISTSGFYRIWNNEGYKNIN